MKPSSFQAMIENQFNNYICKRAMEEMKRLEKEQQAKHLELRKNKFTTLLPLLTINS